MEKDNMPQFKFKQVELSGELYNKVLQRINRERELLTIKRRLVIFSVSLAVSLVAFFPVINLVRAGFAESGFLQFFKLIFSDFEVIKMYWQNFVLILLESLPISGIIMLLITLLIFIESLNILARDLRVFLQRNKLLNS
jgi:hypothetical protein